jgi:hypothetical protein
MEHKSPVFMLAIFASDMLMWENHKSLFFFFFFDLAMDVLAILVINLQFLNCTIH